MPTSSTTTVVFFASNPAATSPLRLGEELRTIEAERRAGRLASSFAVLSAWEVRPEDLLQRLLDLKEHSSVILHFSGHGEAEGLTFADEDGEVLPVAGESLARLLKVFPACVRLVVLNACYSDEQCQQIADAVGCAVGMTASIADAAAERFARGFYKSLFGGESVGRAVDCGLALIDQYGHTDVGLPGARRDVADSSEHHPRRTYASVPVLRHRGDVDPDQLFFSGSSDAASSRGGRHTVGFDTTTLRFGITMGLALGRLEFLMDSSFPEARAASPAVERSVLDMLALDAIHPSYASYRELVASILTRYAVTSSEKHASILIGICATRLSLGKVKEEGSSARAELDDLALSALAEIEDDVVPLPLKRAVFDELRKARPHTVVDVIRAVRTVC
jgi:hypothetical protein